MHVLMVCSGNTCRSPMAAAILARQLEQAGPPGIRVTSAGTGAMQGAPASEGAYLVALEDGLDLSAHRSRLLTPALIRDADLILAMSQGHLRRVEELGGGAKAFLLSAYAGEEDGLEVADPFGGSVEEYRQTYRELTRLLDGTHRRLTSEAPHDQR